MTDADAKAIEAMTVAAFRRWQRREPSHAEVLFAGTTVVTDYVADAEGRTLKARDLWGPAIARFARAPGAYDALFADQPEPPAPLPDPAEAPFRGRLRRDGPRLRDDDGPWVWLMASGLLAVEEFALGHLDRLAAFYADLRGLGFRGVTTFMRHTFCRWPALERFEATPDLARAYVDHAAQHGMAVDAVLGADWEETYRDDAGAEHQNPLHRDAAYAARWSGDVWRAIEDAPNLAHGRVINEPQFNGGLDLLWRIVEANGWQDAARRPVLMDAGDFDIVGMGARWRHLDTFGSHSDRKPSYAGEALKLAHYVRGGWAPDAHNDGFAGADVAVLETEPCKAYDAPDEDIARGQFGEQCQDRMREAAVGWAGFGAGCTFHSVDGIFARPFGPVTRACASAMAEGARLFPPEVAHGRYSHDGLPDFPLLPEPDDRNVFEVVGYFYAGLWYVAAALHRDSAGRPMGAWEPKPKAGHRVLDVLAPHAVVVL